MSFPAVGTEQGRHVHEAIMDGTRFLLICDRSINICPPRLSNLGIGPISLSLVTLVPYFNMTTPENHPVAAPTNAIDVISRRYASGKQTFILTLTFPDLSQVGDLLKRIEYGVHCWELRCDLLSPSGAAEESNIPSAEYVQNQIRCLRSHSNLPIFFSLRMKSQGGRFPDVEVVAAVELISLAVNLKCEYVEWNINWPLDTLKRITSKATRTKIVGSEYDITGDLRWTDAGVRDICKSIDQYAGEAAIISFICKANQTFQTSSV